MDTMKHIIKYYGSGKELKVLFVGNSITRTPVDESIGWVWDYGMAASCAEKDYVHVMMREIDKKYDASYCVCRAPHWEVHYTHPEEYMPGYQEAIQFDPDIIIMRLIENVPKEDFDPAFFRKQYEDLLDYFNPEGRAKYIITDGFWRHPGDEVIRAVAEDRNYDFVPLGDLGDQDALRAIGRFEDDGVCAHPGDEGMEQIALRLLEHID